MFAALTRPAQAVKCATPRAAACAKESDFGLSTKAASGEGDHLGVRAIAAETQVSSTSEYFPADPLRPVLPQRRCAKSRPGIRGNVVRCILPRTFLTFWDLSPPPRRALKPHLAEAAAVGLLRDMQSVQTASASKIKLSTKSMRKAFQEGKKHLSKHHAQQARKRNERGRQGTRRAASNRELQRGVRRRTRPNSLSWVIESIYGCCNRGPNRHEIRIPAPPCSERNAAAGKEVIVFHGQGQVLVDLISRLPGKARSPANLLSRFAGAASGAPAKL